MKVSKLGEFGLIEILNQVVSESGKTNPDLIIGIGDDTAAWQFGESVQLGTTDMLIEGIHFNLNTISWHDLGWKSLAVNISDIAAMGGTPEYAMIALGLPPQTEVEQVTELYRGMAEIARQFGLNIIGGDTNEAPLLIISPTVTGRAEKDHLLTRSGAKQKDMIAVTGTLGASAAGLKLLQGKMRFDSKSESILKESHLRPYPRVSEGKTLIRHGVKSAIDISDGLIADLSHICEASKVGARIFAANLPIHPAVKTCFPEEALSLALSGGEDYELLFTAPEEIIESIKQQLAISITIIGEIIGDNPGKVTVLDENGKPVIIPKAGWEHFGK